MDLVTLFAIGFGLAMDAFAVSVAYGLSFERRWHLSALKIAFAFGLFQAGMPLLGWFGGHTLAGYIEPVDHWIAVIVLGYLGASMLRGAIQSGAPAEISTELRTLLGLAVATSIDALAVGLLVAVLEVQPLLPIVIFGSVTFAVSYAGIVSGYEMKSLLRRRGRRIVQGVGGVVLIAIGVRILVEHLMGASAGR